MNTPKLILLYGFASSGKTTLSKKYISEHPLSMSIEGDQIISMIGGWRGQWEQAREMVHEYTKKIVESHLDNEHDVLLPYLLLNPVHAEDFENIAKEKSVDFYEVNIEIKREEAIKRLLERGVWGEGGSPQLTEKDLPEINKLYDTKEKATSHREDVKSIESKYGNIDDAYASFLEAIS